MWRVILSVVCCACVLSTVLAASCPPLQPKTVVVSCVSKGSPFNCTEQPSPPGTVASFRCKPLHQFVFGYLPPTGYESRCGDNGEWSAQPFRCAPVCGRPTGKPTAFVRDGQAVSSAADYPWHVTIYDVILDMKQICGGSLITAKFFVSAAHCFHDNVAKPMPPERYVAAFARTKRSIIHEEPKAQYKQLIKIHMKDYGAKKLQYANDISLVELDSEVDVTAWTLPVCVDWGLELSDLRHGQEGTVVGFGHTADVASEELRFAKLPFIRGDECSKHVSDNLAIFTHLPDKFCVGFVNTTSVAPGDSGGGMAFPSDDRIWYLRGVVSVGSSQETTYSYFTNVTAFVPWISSVIQEGEVTGRRCGVDVVESGVVDGAKVDGKDFPWEVEVYYKRASNRNFERLWSAVLVQPNLAITTVLVNVPPGHQIDLSEYPAPWLRVASRRNTDSFELSEAAHVSEVVRAFYPDDVLINSALIYNFILLELKQPMNLMPVCLDWSGGALLQKRDIGTTIQQAPDSNAQVWRRYPILGAEQCRAMLQSASEAQNICVEEVGAKAEPPLHHSLLVSVDNTWFLRGVLSHVREPSDRGYTLQYTDMSDPGVIKWLAKTRDYLGKPTCGNINLCEAMDSDTRLPGHLPWNVAVVVDEGGRSVTKGSGLLIQPNAVLTDASLVLNKTGGNTKQGLPFVAPASVSVLWTDDEGRAMRSGVARLEVHDAPSGGAAPYDVALLEVDPGAPVDATPACLDLSGNVLELLGSGALGLVEGWREWAPVSNHTLASSQYRLRTDCFKTLHETHGAPEYSASRQFCTTAKKDVVDANVLGGGFFVYTGNKWFIQGMFSGFVKTRRSALLLAYDFADANLRAWLRKKLDRLQIVESKSDDSGPKTCAGGPNSKSKCGVFVPIDVGVPEGEDPLKDPTLNHMEWNVDVHVDYKKADGQWSVRAGTVVSAKMVITSSVRLVTTSPTGAPRTISTSDIIVKYISADSRDRRITEIERIHVRERTGPGAPRDDAWRFDLALLELRTAVSLTPLCVPAPGSVGGALPALVPGTVGQVELFADANRLDRALTPTRVLESSPSSLRTSGDCQRFSHLSSDQFCSQSNFSPKDGTTAELGAAFSAATNGTWYLRGVMGVDWRRDGNGSRPEGALVFYNLDDAEVLVWLDSKMRAREATATTTTTTTRRPSPATTSPPEPYVHPNPLPASGQCGGTVEILDRVPHNGSIPGHLPWSVTVSRAKPNGGQATGAGVLIRADLVLTEGHSLVTPLGRWNDSGDVSAVDVRLLRVVWTSSSGIRKRSEVAELLVHERDRGPRQDIPWDVALLKLRTPFRTSPLPCLDLAGILPSLQPLATGQVGVMESWRGDVLDGRTNLVSSPLWTIVDCRKRLADRGFRQPQKLTSDRFCTEQLSETVWDGAAFLVKTGQRWYVRGILSFSWADPNGPYGVADLQDESVREWLREKMNVNTRMEVQGQQGPPAPATTTASNADVIYFED